MFKPGQSGNPGGRKKADPEFVRAVREAAKGALERIVALSKDAKDQKVRLQASIWLAERAHGKPAQSIDHTSSDGTMTPVRPVDAPPQESREEWEKRVTKH